MKSYILESAEHRDWWNGIRSDFVDRLMEYVGETVYGEDVGFMLTETENVNGAWCYSGNESESEMIAHPYEFAVVLKTMRESFGYSGDPLEQPRLVHCACMIEMYKTLWDMVYYNNPEVFPGLTFELTKEMVFEVEREVRLLDFEDLFG